MTKARRPIQAILCMLVLWLAACDGSDDPPYRPTYGTTPVIATPILTFGVHPLHNPETLVATYQPILDYVNARLDGPKLNLEASRNYAAYEEKLAQRRFHFALPNPYQTLLSLKYGYRVFGKMGDDSQFRGIILIRRDSPIGAIADLKGKSISYPAPTALAATMLPQAFLARGGLNVERDIDNRYVGSQESAIMNVFLGMTSAGATWPPPWQKFQRDEPAKAAELMVKWQTESLPNNGLVVRDDVAPELAAKVAAILFSMHRDTEGSRLLEQVPLSRFEPADDGTYAPVRRFLEWFRAEVREVALP